MLYTSDVIGYIFVFFVFVQITYDAVGNHYSIRDLGSAGGTFIRIPFGKKKELIPGVILLLGKHQFIVERIECGGTSGGSDVALNSEADEKGTFRDDSPTVRRESNARGSAAPSGSPREEEALAGAGGADDIEDIVGEAEDLLNALEMIDSSVSDEER